MNSGLQAFFGFTRPPFGPVLDPAQLIHAHSRDELVFGVVDDVLIGRPVVAIEGEHGVGKTILADTIAARLQMHRLTVIRLAGRSDGSPQVQQRIGQALGIETTAGMGPQDLLRAAEANSRSDIIALLFDDADAVPESMFRYLWLLAQLFNFGHTRLHLILVGTVGTWRGLQHPDLGPLRMAAGKPVMIRPLEQDEAEDYLERKMRLAGGSLRRVMTSAAKSELLEKADGIPGQIDALAERALTQGYQAGQRRITRPALQEALLDIDGFDAPRRPLRLPWRTAGLVAAAMLAGYGIATLPTLGQHPVQVERTLPAPAAPPAPAPVSVSVPAAPAPKVEQLRPPRAPALAEPPPAPASAPPPAAPLPFNAGQFLISPTRVTVSFVPGDAGAEHAAHNVAAALLAKGLLVIGPAPAALGTGPHLAYYFARDRAAAAAVADTSADLIGAAPALQLIRANPLPPPGTVELVIASH